DVDGADFADLREALAGIQLARFEMKVRGLGCFPPRGSPNILWAGIDSGDSLRALHASVERIVRGVGLPAEDRKFHAHVTLARLKETPQRRLADYLAANALFEAPRFTLREVSLLSSV